MPVRGGRRSIMQDRAELNANTTWELESASAGQLRESLAASEARTTGINLSPYPRGFHRESNFVSGRLMFECR
jgi:hypothetical protein